MPSTSREVTFLEADQLGMLFEALLDEAHHDKEVYAHTFPPSLAYWDIVSREYALRLVEELVMYKQAFHENKVQADQTKLLDVLVTLDTLIKLLEIEDLFRRKANGVHDVFVLPVRNWLDKASEGWLFLLRFSLCCKVHLVSNDLGSFGGLDHRGSAPRRLGSDFRDGTLLLLCCGYLFDVL